MATVRRLKAVLEGQDAGATALFGKLKGAVAGLGAIAAAVGVGALGRQLVKGLTEATKAAGVQEKAELKLGKALSLIGVEANNALPDLKSYASSLQDLTGVGDEVILSNQALLVSLGKLSGDTLKQATQASLDLSAAIGVDQRTAFDLVAKAASGYTGTLSRYGIILDESIPEGEKFAAVLDTINKQFGGQAQAQLGTFEGRLAEFQGRLGDLKEAIGGPFLESVKVVLANGLSPFIKRITDVVGKSNVFRDTILLAGAALARLADIAIRTIAPLLRLTALFSVAAVGTFVRDLTRANEVLKVLGAVLDEKPTFFADIANDLEGLIGKTSEFKFATQDAFEGPPSQIELLNEQLSTLGIRLGEEIAGEAAVVEDAFKKLNDALFAGLLSEEEYDRIAAKLKELAVTLNEEGGVLPSFVAVETTLFSINDAINLLIERGIAGLRAELKKFNGELESVGATIKKQLKGVAVDAALRFGDALVEAAFGGEVSFKQFFKQLLKDLAKAIVQALILRAILGAVGFGGGGGFGQGGFVGPPALNLGGRIPAQGGLTVPGADIGRDSVPAILRPGELVFPRELSDFILGLAGGSNTTDVEVELKADIPLLVERVNTGVRQGFVNLIATKLSTTRQVR